MRARSQFGADGLDARPRPAARRADARARGALLVNSPNNPTGWTLDARRAGRRSSRIAARHGIWIVADDVYERLVLSRRARRRAPSFLDLADAGRARRQHQQLLEVVADDRLAAGLDRRAAGADARPRQADRVQHVVRAGVRAARRRRRDRATARRSSRARARGCGARAIPARRRAARDCRGIEVAPPPGAMYAFFRVDGARRQPRVLQAARARGAARASRRAVAFGPEGEGFVRWCFAASEARLDEGVAAARAASSPRRGTAR